MPAYKQQGTSVLIHCGLYLAPDEWKLADCCSVAGGEVPARLEASDKGSAVIGFSV